ncbi:hypothetical protein [Yersinia ruckeri]|uniref:hypothetical protein n=1 Tax=Yersinia ruckeri TaxID=29486 RepID=UPI00223897A0|nr:hypothetical protein [Yersinia ruckeri]MCW6598660.1 hypothetical protein [Yersinia ruckeri]
MTTQTIQQSGAGINEFIRGNPEVRMQQQQITDKAADALDKLLDSLTDSHEMLDDLILIVDDTRTNDAAYGGISDSIALPPINEYIPNKDALMDSELAPYLPLDKMIGAQTTEDDIFPLLATSQIPEFRPPNSVIVDVPYDGTQNYPVTFIPVEKVPKETLISKGITDYLGTGSDSYSDGRGSNSYYVPSGAIIPSVNDDMTSLQDKMNPILGSVTSLKKKSKMLSDLLNFDTDPESLVDKVRSYYDSIMDQINKVGAVLATINAIKSMIENLICSICSMFGGLPDFNFTLNLFQSLLGMLMAIWNMIKSIYDQIKNIIMAILSLFDLSMFNLNLNCGCLDKIKGIIDAVTNDVAGAIKETSVSGALDGIRKVASAAGANVNLNVNVGGVNIADGDLLSQSPTGIISNGVDNVAGAAQSGLDSVGSFVSNAKDDSSMFANVASNNIENSIDTVSNIGNTVSDKVSDVAEVGTSLRDSGTQLASAVMEKANKFSEWSPS